jgi:threonine dehydratase
MRAEQIRKRMTVELSSVESAAARIRPYVRRTPVMEADGACPEGDVFFKLELLQHTGTFKARGAYNRVLAAKERGELTQAGVIMASGGNAGLALAHAAGQLGVRAEIFVPTTSSPVKVARLRALGADVTVTGDFYPDAYDACLARAAETDAVLVHAYDQPEIVAGQGTLGLELAADIEGLSTVIAAVGGGGLAGGIAAAIGRTTRIVAVEPERIPTFHDAQAAGEPVDVEVGGVAAESLGARRIGAIAWDCLRAAKAESVLVTDEAILDARQWLWDEFRIVVEPGGAAAVAALRTGAYVPEHGERVAVVLCGANTDPSDLA